MINVGPGDKIGACENAKRLYDKVTKDCHNPTDSTSYRNCKVTLFKQLAAVQECNRILKEDSLELKGRKFRSKK